MCHTAFPDKKILTSGDYCQKEVFYSQETIKNLIRHFVRKGYMWNYEILQIQL